MDLTTLEIQIFVSLALVLGAVFVALLTDFLKGNNEALRERNIELLVRQQERERYFRRQESVAPSAPPASPRKQAGPVFSTAPPDAGPMRPAPEFEETEPPEIRIEPKPERWATEAELGEVDYLADRIRKRAAVNPVDYPVHLDPSHPTAPDIEKPVAEPGELGGPQAIGDLAQPDKASGGPLAQELAAELERARRTEQRMETEPGHAETAPGAGVEAEEEVSAAEEEAETAAADGADETASKVRFQTAAGTVPGEDSERAQEPAPEARTEAERDESSPELQPSEPVESPSREAAREENEAGGPASSQLSESVEPSGSVFGKVTPIDVLAAGRAAARDTFRLARELERVAGLVGDNASGESGEKAQADQPATPETVSEAVGETAATSTPPEESVAETADTLHSEAAAGSDEAREAETPGAETGDRRTVRIPGAQTPSLGELQLPPGFHDYSVFAEALSSQAAFRGTVVALSVTGADESGTLKEIEDFLRSLLTPADFACRSGKDEFLLILPGETGAASQRRLQYISQRLWDYQIRSVARQPVMFSWGAADMSAVQLREVVSAARDRMWQTRRSRERLTAEFHLSRHRVANET